MKRRNSPAKSRQSDSGQFRIIGGDWRGRKFLFPAEDGLRPTPDRVRETLFNWLQNECSTVACLDLFAGSGALGMEALSRGAESCVFIEKNRQAAQAIKSHLAVLNNDSKVINGDLPQALDQLGGKFSLVFIDPPYAMEILETILKQLLQNDLLEDEAWIYIENSSKDLMPMLEDKMTIHRQKSVGQVQSTLISYSSEIA